MAFETVAIANSSSVKKVPFSTKEECTTVRLDEPGEPFYNYPYQKQESVGNCYAHVATKLIDAWRFQRGEGQTKNFSSAIEASLQYAANTHHSNGPRGGFTCGVVDVLRSVGSCDYNRFNNLTSKRDDGVYIDKLMNYYKFFHSDSLFATERAKQKVPLKICKYLSKNMINPEFHPGLQEVLQSLDQNDKKQFLVDLLSDNQNGCTKESRIKLELLPQCQTRSIYSSPQKTASMIHSFLDEPHIQPVGIGYCAQVLESSGFRGINRRGNNGNRNFLPSDQCTGHGSVIIGRRFHKKKCQFLVFGSSHHTEDSEGKVWVDEDDLAANIFQYQFL